MASATMSTTPHLALAAAADTGSPQSYQATGARSDDDPSVPHDHVAVALANWRPAPHAVNALVDLLAMSTSADSAVQRTLFGRLQAYASEPDFNNYLAYILVTPNPVTPMREGDLPQFVEVRQAAGLLLKSNLQLVYTALHPMVRNFVYAHLVDAIGDRSAPVREVVASCLSTLVLYNPHMVAPSGLIASLSASLDSARPTYLDGSLSVLSRLAEDGPNLFEEDPSQPLDILIPKIINLCQHPSETVRATSLKVLNHLLIVTPRSLQANVDVLCNTLFRVAEDSSAQVRMRVCTAICLLFDNAPHAFAQSITSVIEYMLASSVHPDESVAKEASEFWSLLAQRHWVADTLRPYMPRLAAVLLHNMVHSADDRAKIDAEDNRPDDTLSNQTEDIRPRFHRPRLMGSSTNCNFTPVDVVTNHEGANGYHGPNGTNGVHASARNGFGYESDDDDEDFYNHNDRFGQGASREEEQANLRRVSAAALDALAMVFKDELLEILLPGLQKKLTDADDWAQRECGVLALGAIAEGCYSGMSRHMRTIFPFLLRSVSDQHYMVRCLSCWTLSRYTKWVVNEREDALFQQLLKVLLDRMLDRSKEVRKAACSALASCEEEAGALLSSYLSPILRSLTSAFECYHQSNLYGLYDVVSTLAEAVGSELATLEHMNVLMPLLISQWNSVSDTDTALLPLLECLGFIFRAIGVRSQQFAANIFSRCANIMDVVYSKESRGEQEDVHVELLICSLDLMCGLAEALGAGVDPYLAQGGERSKAVLTLLFVAMKDDRQDVRQCAFALLGELAKARVPSLLQALPEFVRFAVDALNPEYSSVANNATWALGELVMMAGFLPPNVPVDREGIQATLLEGAAEQLIRTVNSPQLNKTLLENSAITLGRMGLVMSDRMAGKLDSFAEPVFALLRNIMDDVEKEQAFHGMNAMIRRNPTAILSCFVYYLDAVSSWYHCKRDLEMEFATILGSFKTSLGDRWITLFHSVPQSLRSLLQERFRL